jgi:hypothetical protein
VAVNCAVPTVPGMQTWGLVRESHVPAQALPLLAIVTTVGLLDRKENVSLMTLFCAPRAVAVNDSVFPTSSDTFEPTAAELVNATLVGTALPPPTRVGLLLPQDARKEQDRSAQLKAARETSLPMNPSD